MGYVSFYYLKACDLLAKTDGNGVSFLSYVCLSSSLYRSCKYMIRKANTGPNLPHGDENRIMEVCNEVRSCLFNPFLFLSNLSF